MRREIWGRVRSSGLGVPQGGSGASGMVASPQKRKEGKEASGENQRRDPSEGHLADKVLIKGLLEKLMLDPTLDTWAPI